MKNKFCISVSSGGFRVPLSLCLYLAPLYFVLYEFLNFRETFHRLSVCRLLSRRDTLKSYRAAAVRRIAVLRLELKTHKRHKRASMRKVRKIVGGIGQSHLKGRDFLGENRAIELELRISGVFLGTWKREAKGGRYRIECVCMCIYV